MSIYKKLFEAKKEIGKISKDSKNPFFKSKYFDVNSLLEHVEPILQKHNLLLLQPITSGAVSSIIYDIDEESGKNYMSSSIPLPQLTDPQKLGSAITYYRRYTLQSLLGLQAEDDDGNLASKPTPKTKQKLSDDGFKFLTSTATKEQVQKALNEREMTKEQRDILTKKLK